ncbi:MAG: hypothetical protein RLZZ558_339 [Planctomycetota bacterium]
MKRAPHALVVFSFALATGLAVAGVNRDQAVRGGLQPQRDLAADPGPVEPDNIRERFLRTFPRGGLFGVTDRIRRAWGTTFSRGSSPSDSVSRFFREWSGLWSVSFQDMLPVGPFEDGAHLLPLVSIDGTDGACAFTGVYFTQSVMGVPVFRAYGWGLVRNEDNFPTVLAGGTMRPVGDIASELAGLDLNPANLNPGIYGREALNRFGAPPTVSSPRYVIWAGIDDDIQPARLAVEFTATGGGNWDPENYMHMQFVVDAQDGTVLHEESLIRHQSVTGQVNGFVTNGIGADACNPEASRGLPYVGVNVGGTTIYANVNGAFTSGTVSGTVSVQPSLNGLYFRVVEPGGATTVPAQSVPSGGSATFTFNPTPTEIITAQTNAYLHANIVRDFTLAVSPNYPTVSTQTNFPVNTSVSGTCNAFYDGSSINFYRSGGGCNNTAFDGVVHHEYGHHLVNRGGSGQGAYGEGQSDVMAALILDDPRLGVGFQTCSTGIRNADNNCQYSASGCSSCGSAIHSCGQLISGCVWDLRTLFRVKYPATYTTETARLAVNSIPLHAGQSDIAADITIDYLTLNDNNGDIADGTPDYTEIADAFGQHGLDAPALSLLKIEYPQGRPILASPAGTTPVRARVSALAGQPGSTVRLMAKAQGASTFSMVPMTNQGSGEWQANLPAGSCPSAVQYYVEALTTTGAAVRSPSDAPAAFFSATVAEGQEIAFEDNVETVQGWQLGITGDTATTGRWVRGNPIGTTAQPENANSPSNCFFTGQGTQGGALGEADVDGGRTTLVSPPFDLSGADAAVLRFAYWHSNDTGALPNEDPFLVQVSSNGTNWVQIASLNTNLEAWATLEYRLDGVIALTSSVRVRFISLDEGAGGSLVESAVDDVSISAISCVPENNCPSDLDGNGTVDAADIGAILLAFGNCSGCPADLDGNGTVDAADIGAILLAYGNCP